MGPCATIVAPHQRTLHWPTQMTIIDFGIVFDIDGVIYRGGEILPGAKETIEQVQRLFAVKARMIRRRLGDGQGHSSSLYDKQWDGNGRETR